MEKNRINLFRLIISIFICQCAGIIGSFFTTSAIKEWYVHIPKPWFTPPNWVFGPVWITLYTLMGIALYLVWQKGIFKNKEAISIFGIQLALNAIWSIIFFGMKNVALAFWCIAALWVFIGVTIDVFYKIDKRTIYLLVPYIVWVSIASALNLGIWLLMM